MNTVTFSASDFRRAVLACAKVVASPNDGRPLLSGIHVHVSGDDVAVVATDSFRLTRVALHRVHGGRDALSVTIEAAPLVRFAKALGKTRFHTVTLRVQDGTVVVMTDAAQSETIPTIAGTYPDYAAIIRDNGGVSTYAVDTATLAAAVAPLRQGIRARRDTPFVAHLYGNELRELSGLIARHADGQGNEVFTRRELAAEVASGVRLGAFNPSYLAELCAIAPARMTYAHDSANRGATFAWDDVTYVLMPLVIDTSKPAGPEYAPQHWPTADAAELDDGTTTCLTCGRALDDGGASFCAECLTDAQTPAVDVGDALIPAAADHAGTRCPNCGAPAAPNDRYCGQCGARLSHEAAPQPDHKEAAAVEAFGGRTDDQIMADIASLRAKYSVSNVLRILSACPHATDVRGMYQWNQAGRKVKKGQRGIMIYTPAGYGPATEDGKDDGRFRVKRAYVFDVSQTEPSTRAVMAEAAAPQPRVDTTPAAPVMAAAAVSVPRSAPQPALRADDI